MSGVNEEAWRPETIVIKAIERGLPRVSLTKLLVADKKHDFMELQSPTFALIELRILFPS